MKALTATNIHVTIAALTIVLLPCLQPRNRCTLHAHNSEQRHGNVPLACISAHSHYITHALYTWRHLPPQTSMSLSQRWPSCSSRVCNHATDAPCMHATVKPWWTYAYQCTITFSDAHTITHALYTWRHLPPQTSMSLSQHRQSCSSRDCNHATNASCMHATLNKGMPMYQ
jgi:hypothetical protein